MELKRDGIRTLLVCPGYVKTGFQQHVTRGRNSRKSQTRAPHGQLLRSNARAISAAVWSATPAPC